MNSINGIYALCDNSLTPQRSHAEIAERLLRGGVKILQLRIKGETDPARVQTAARSIQALKKDFDFTFILNDFVELAKALNVDGVHIGRDDATLEATRRIVGADCLVGYSSHSVAEAVEAERLGADYVAFGAIYPTASKGPGHPVQGLEKLREVVRALKVPVVAIGGIKRNNIQDIVATGVAAVAMIGALAGAKDIEAEARWFTKTVATKI